MRQTGKKLRKKWLVHVATGSYRICSESESVPISNTRTWKNKMSDHQQITDLSASLNTIAFESQGHDLAAHLYTPEGFDTSLSYPAVIFSPPFNQVKEQTGAV